MDIIGYAILGFLGLTLVSGIRIIRPTEKGVRETLGKYSGYIESGFNYVIPFFQRIHRINITENMVNVDPQDIITKDNLNAKVDLVVFYKIMADEENIKNAFYNVNNVEDQIVTLAQTTARNVIGAMVFRDVNSKRNELNLNLAKVIDKQTLDWGVKIVRVELKEIAPPKDVQETMNRVIKAENEKEAAIDFATAQETQADGIKRAKIKEAEGQKQFSILVAEGQAKAFDLVNKSFKGGAKELKELEVTENSLKGNSKIVLGQSGKDILKLLNVDK